MIKLKAGVKLKQGIKLKEVNETYIKNGYAQLAKIKPQNKKA